MGFIEKEMIQFQLEGQKSFSQDANLSWKAGEFI
jgi:hypothetical protein